MTTATESQPILCLEHEEERGERLKVGHDAFSFSRINIFSILIINRAIFRASKVYANFLVED
jgi:hypothetical protein